MARNHEFSHFHYEKTNTFKSVCSCGESSFEVATPQDREDWERKHRTGVERTKAALSHGKGNLTQLARHCREQYDRERDPEKRRLWKQLADEIDHRLGKDAPPSQQEPLF